MWFGLCTLIICLFLFLIWREDNKNISHFKDDDACVDLNQFWMKLMLIIISNISLLSWAMVIYKEASNCVQLVDAPSDGKRDDCVEQLVFLHPADETLDVDPQPSNGRCLHPLISRQRFPFWQESMSVDFAWHTVINKKTFVNHYCHSRIQQRHNPRLLKKLLVTDRSCIQGRHKGDLTMWCHAD